MGYIKKLKNNELVGGTDKHTIYPVTSTKAVFEEITNGNESSFKSQETINKEQQDELDDHEERIQAAEAEDIKSITINGSTKEFKVDDRNNVDLTIYTVDNDPEMPSIASNVEDLRNMVGTSTPVLETSHKTRIETLEGDESVTGSVENKIKTKVDSINSSYQDDDNEYVKYSMTQTSGKVTDFNIDETNLKNAITSLSTSISGTNIIIVPQNQNLPSTGNAGTIYRKINAGNTYTDYMYSNGWKELATHDTSSEQSQVAYYTCTATGSGAQATKQFVSNGSLEYTPSSGGHIKILMGEANTATGTIYLQYNTDATNTKKPLYYNGEPVSPENTWEGGETIAVYYDPSANSNAGAYFASNAQGFNKLNVDTSESDLDINDDSNNTLVRFSDGHVKTKNFDSREIKTSVDDTESADFNVSDEDGNVVLSVGDGHIKTKNFDSSNIELDKYAKKKTIKYLAIGNSVNQDPACYIPYLLRKLYGDDIDFEIGVAYHGSYTIKDYVELMITGQENLETFSYAKNTGHLTNITNVPLSYAVSYADWDIVSFEAYQTDMAGSGRTEDITLAPDLLDWLKQHTKDGCRYGLITPATYTDVRDLYVGWQQDILTSCSLDFLLDYGATKEFLIAKGFVNSELSPLEGGKYIHSKEGFPCEALALTAIHFIADIAKFDDKASNLLVQITEAEHNALDVPQQNGTYTSTTAENWRKCVDAALNGWRVSCASYAISNNTLRDNTFTNI